MNSQTSLPRFFAVALVLAAVCSPSFAGGKAKKSCCPKCKTCCELKVEEGTEEKHCWKVESKVICIPRVAFSWQWPFKKKSCKQECDANCKKPCCAPPKLVTDSTGRWVTTVSLLWSVSLDPRRLHCQRLLPKANCQSYCRKG